jgi:hypothetical protein
MCNFITKILIGVLTTQLAAEAVYAQSHVRLRAEQSPSSGGPWTAIQINEQNLQIDGSFIVPAQSDSQFFRLLIEMSDDLPFDSIIPVTELPEDVITRAETFLETSRTGTEARENGYAPDPGWDDKVSIAPYAYPIYDPAVSDGRIPAYIEFKMIRDRSEEGEDGYLGSYSEQGDEDAGSLTLSLTEGDFPVVGFSTEGKTEVEQLQVQSRSLLIKPVRYGSGLLVAEKPDGNPVAFDGTYLFKFPEEFADLINEKSQGEQLDEPVGKEPLDLPELAKGLTFHCSYAEMKRDYVESPVYRIMRQERARAAELAWKVEKGDWPNGISLGIGESTDVLLGEFGLSWEVDEEPGIGQRTVLRIITGGREGGLTVTGAGQGFATLAVNLDDGSRIFFAVEVSTKRGTAKLREGEKSLDTGVEWITTETYAGGWGNQSKFSQWKAPEFCKNVGCGPTAYSILWAWHENWSKIDMPFGDPRFPGAPYEHDVNSQQIYDTQKALHEFCDTFCPPFTNNGATFPWDMPEGAEGYLFIYRLFDFLGRSHGWAYEWPCNGFDDGAWTARWGIVNRGVPAVLGVGFYSHYAVAYGYRYRRLVVNGSTIWSGRYFKCNWGNGGSVKWRNGADTFFGHWYDIWQKANYALPTDFP